MAKKSKFYAVRKGIAPGVYLTWPECEANVKGFPGTEYKSFPTLEDAEAYVAGKKTQAAPAAPVLEPVRPYAFVDGSYNKDTDTAGWGGFLVLEDGAEITLQGSTRNPDLVSMRNVAGEIMGCLDALEKASELGLRRIHIYYDYMGIEEWAEGRWQANKPGTKAYAAAVRRMRFSGLDVKFVKVAAHTGVPGNERADALAKAAAGVS